MLTEEGNTSRQAQDSILMNVNSKLKEAYDFIFETRIIGKGLPLRVPNLFQEFWRLIEADLLTHVENIRKTGQMRGQ